MITCHSIRDVVRRGGINAKMTVSTENGHFWSTAAADQFRDWHVRVNSDKNDKTYGFEVFTAIRWYTQVGIWCW